MNNIIIYKTEENGVAILYPSPSWEGTLEELAAKDVPAQSEWFIIDSKNLPKDGLFRAAWKLKDKQITVDINSAKDIWLDKFRAARKPVLATLDVEFMRAVESGDSIQQSEIVAQKQVLRDVTSIELPDTLDGVKSTWPTILGPKPF
jgi:hypothetical protein